MRINIICPECSQAAGGYAIFYLDTIREDGVYTGLCPRGHRVAVMTQTLQHEMLFEIALNAITDRYNREAVSSFAASVERYFEFAIRVMAKNRNIAPDIFGSAWNVISKLSERQLGAYILLYTVTFGEVPLTFSSSETQFRNGVIHNGVLPDKAAALRFGGKAYEIIQSGIRKLRSRCLEDVNKQLVETVAAKTGKLGSEYPRSTQVTPTALNIIQDISAGYKPFDQLLEERQISS